MLRRAAEAQQAKIELSVERFVHARQVAGAEFFKSGADLPLPLGRENPVQVYFLSCFERGDEMTIYIGSADLMPRNLDTRVELLTPVRDEALLADLVDTLDRCFADSRNSWELGEDGTWARRQIDGEPHSVQRELMAGHAARAAEAAATS